MPSLQCDSCGNAVPQATIDGDELNDPHSYLVDGVNFQVALDALGNMSVSTPWAQHQEVFDKIDKPYWTQLIIDQVTNQHAYLTCQTCGDEVYYSPHGIAAIPGGGVPAPQAPVAPTTLPLGNMGAMGLAGPGLPSQPPNNPGGLPQPPEVAPLPEAGEEAHTPTTLGLPPEVLEKLKKFKEDNPELGPNDGFSPPRRGKS
jgi:hypothetical protein